MAKPTSEWCKEEQKLLPITKRKMLRCPCGKRLLPREVQCIGGEHVGWELPPHKTKPRVVRAKDKRKR